MMRLHQSTTTTTRLEFVNLGLSLLLLLVLSHSSSVNAQQQQQQQRQSPQAANDNSYRLVRVTNESPVSFAIHWQNGQGRFGKRVTPEGVVPDAFFPLRAHVGQVYRIFEVPDPHTGLCLHSITPQDKRWTCYTANSVVGDGHEQEITIDKEFNVNLMDTKIYAQQQAQDALKDCQDQEQFEDDATLMAECLVKATSQSIEEWDQQLAYHVNASYHLGTLLEDHACSNDEEHITSTVPQNEYLWVSHDNIHTVQILLERQEYDDGTGIGMNNRGSSSHSRIHWIKDFIGTDECRAINEYIEKNNNNKANNYDTNKQQKAEIPIPWDLVVQQGNSEGELNPLINVGRRIMEYTNHVIVDSGLNNNSSTVASLQQQPILVSTTYSATTTTAAQQEEEAEEATMIMYCKVPQELESEDDEGGSGSSPIHFRHPGVHIQPENGSAIFIMGQSSLTQQYKECPPPEGQQKQTLTQKIVLHQQQQSPQETMTTTSTIPNEDKGRGNGKVVEEEAKDGDESTTWIKEPLISKGEEDMLHTVTDEFCDTNNNNSNNNSQTEEQDENSKNNMNIDSEGGRRREAPAVVAEE